MKRMIKKIAFIFLLLGFVSLVTACNGGEKPPVTEKINVVFDVNAGNDIVQNDPGVVRIDKGAAVAEPTPAPTRSGYVFGGWFRSEDGSGEPFDFSTKINDNNFVLFAKWNQAIKTHNVTLNFMYDKDNQVIEAEEGKALSVENPTRSGYRFDGWYIDEGLVSKYNLTDLVTSEFTLFAKWVQLFKVTINLNYEGAAAPTILEVDANKVPEIEDPLRDGFEFAGWFEDQENTKPYELAPITKDLVIYAKWVDSSVAVRHAVTFKFNYEGSPSDLVRNVLEGSTTTKPDHTREGYLIEGWYKDVELTDKFLFSTPITEPITLFAKWDKAYTLTINYNYEGSSSPEPIVVLENVAIDIPQSPSRVGYTFAGWSNAKTGLIGFNFSEGISENTTVYAQWSKDHIFEAEHLDFSDFFGWGFSGNATGTDAILHDTDGSAAASNGYFISFLYDEDITLEFEITSDRAISEVTLILRLSGEIKDFFIQSHKTPGNPDQEPVYKVMVNETQLTYPNIYFGDVPGQQEGIVKPFEDFVISTTVSLVEGVNSIKLITANKLGMGGTMWATAPMVDCLKLNTYANLTWEPVLGNY